MAFRYPYEILKSFQELHKNLEGSLRNARGHLEEIIRNWMRQTSFRVAVNPSAYFRHLSDNRNDNSQDIFKGVQETLRYQGAPSDP